MTASACTVFTDMSYLTWKALELCHARSIVLGEDAITSLLLVNLDSRLRATVLYQDTRPQESLCGCDFELLIGTPSKGWLRFAVQAKRISIPNERYPKLNHKVGTAKVDQKRILERYASRVKALPVYALYNFLDSPGPRAGAGHGITIAPLSVIDDATTTRGGQCFKWIHDRAGVFPWQHLVCPAGPLKAGPAHDLSKRTREPHYSDQIPRDVAKWMESGKIPNMELHESAPYGFDAGLPTAVAVVDIS